MSDIKKEIEKESIKIWNISVGGSEMDNSTYSEIVRGTEKDAQNTYNEEINNASEEDKDSIDFTISDDGSAYLSSYDGEYEWTWEVIEV